MLRPAVIKLKELRTACGAGSPSDWRDDKKPLLRMMVTVRTIEVAENVAKVFNEEAQIPTSEFHGLVAESYTGRSSRQTRKERGKI